MGTFEYILDACNQLVYRVLKKKSDHVTISVCVQRFSTSNSLHTLSETEFDSFYVCLSYKIFESSPRSSGYGH